MRDAETYAEGDKARRDAIEAKNEADTASYSAEKSLAEYKDKLPKEVVDEIEQALGDLRAVASGEDAAAIREKARVLPCAG